MGFNSGFKGLNVVVFDVRNIQNPYNPPVHSPTYILVLCPQNAQYVTITQSTTSVTLTPMFSPA